MGKATRWILSKISVGIYISYEETTQKGMDSYEIKADSLIYFIFISFYCNCKLLEGKKQAISFYEIPSVRTVLSLCGAT